MQQDVIPVNPNDAIQTLMARLTNYYTDDSPAMPVRRQDVAPVRQAYSPRPEFMQGPGLMTPQLPQPQMPNLDVQAYAPDMFRGQLPMPRPTQYDSDPLGIENIPIQANPLAELPLGTAIDEQGNLINAQTGAIITPNYQPNY
jgi:hypothetical protein